MTHKEPSEVKDQELLDEKKKANKNAIVNALLIGLMIGVVIFSFAKNGFSFFILIPLFIVYKIVNSSKSE